MHIMSSLTSSAVLSAYPVAFASLSTPDMRSSILQEATAAIARATVWQEAALAAIIVVLLVRKSF